MLHWIVDSALLLYVILGLFGLGFALLYRNNRDRRSLLALAGIVGLGLVLWGLTLIVVSDRQQIERSLHAMARATLENRSGELRKHLADDFRFRGLDAEAVANKAGPAAKMHGVVAIRLAHIRVENASRSEGKADVTFSAWVESTRFETTIPAQIEARFVWRNNVWLMQSLEVYPAAGKTPLQFSIP